MNPAVDTPDLPLEPLTATGPEVAAPELRRRAARDGYLYLPGLLATAEVTDLRARVLSVCAQLGWLDPAASPDQARPRPGVRGPGYQGPAFTELQRRVQVLEAFQALGRAPQLLRVLAVLLGGTPRPGLGSLCRVLLPGDVAAVTPPHQDRFYLRREPRFWTVWLPLGDCSLEQGPLALLPGSHRGGLRPPGDDGCPAPAPWAAGDFQSGDVLLFHALTVHRTCPNRSPRLRLSVDYRYGPLSSGAGAPR